MIYHLTSVTMAIIKPMITNVDKGCGEKLYALLVGMLNDSAIMENSTLVSHKINNRVPFNTAIPLQVHIKEIKTGYGKMSALPHVLWYAQ